MDKKFFFISQVFYPDEVSTAGLFTNLCEKIKQKNIEVEVWCAQPSYNTTTRQASKIKYKGLLIRYLLSTNFRKDITFGRIINYLTYSFSLLFRLLFAKDKTPIFVSTNPPFIGFLVALVSSIRKRNFFYIVQDIYPDGLIRVGKLRKKGIIAFLWRKANKFILKRSNKVIIIGRDMKLWVKQTFASAIAKTVYIPIWQDENIINVEKIEKSTLVKKHELQNKFIVQYSGNMGLWNDMATFGKAVNRQQDSEVHYLFIGDGIRKKELLNEIDDSSMNNFTCLPFQAKDQLSISLAACHVALVSLRNELEGIAVPSKIIGILASGRPTIALVPKNSEIAKIVNEENCGVVIEPGDSSGLNHAIRKLKSDNSLREKMGKNARKAFENKYTSSIIAERYIRLLK